MTMSADKRYDGIVVLGVPRSGTTLVRRLLDAHPRIHCPPETNLLRACARFLREEPMSGGVAVGVRSGLAFSGIDEPALLSRLQDFAFGILGDLAAKAGKDLWAEKTAFDSFYVDEIEVLCASRCRFVVVFRHGIDVAVSLHELAEKMQMYAPELHDYIRRFAWPLEAFATAWLDVTQRLTRFAEDHRERCFIMRYEDLVGDPAKVLGELCCFLEAPADVSQLIAAASAGGTPGLGDWKTYQLESISDRSLGRWRTLPPDVLARLAPIANPGLQQLGYDPIEIKRMASGATARRALQLSLLAGQLKAKGGGQKPGE